MHVNTRVGGKFCVHYDKYFGSGVDGFRKGLRKERQSIKFLAFEGSVC